MSIILAQGLVAFLTTIATTKLLARAAPALGLIDKPSARKHHSGAVPVVGGLALLCTMLLGGILWGDSIADLAQVQAERAIWIFMGCGAFLVVTGALDDRYELGALVNLTTEILAAVAVIELLDVQVAHLGNLFGTGHIQLPPSLAYPFTVISIFGVINALNMMDGVDGALASLVLCTMLVFHVFVDAPPTATSMFLVCAILGFLVSNLSLNRFVPKTFLGDSGSRLLGFIVACLLITATSGQIGPGKPIQPVTALFLIALPLFDMVLTTVRRMLKGVSPFSADRTHIHHLLKDIGCSDKQVLFAMLAMHLFFNLLGLALNRFKVLEFYQMTMFLSCFAVYSLLISRTRNVVTKLSEHR